MIEGKVCIEGDFEGDAADRFRLVDVHVEAFHAVYVAPIFENLPSVEECWNIHKAKKYYKIQPKTELALRGIYTSDIGLKRLENFYWNSMDRKF